jgi:hypothetical protein
VPIWKMNKASAVTEALEDASLELSAYYQALENLGGWLRAHDGVELDDLAGYLVAWATAFDDQGAYLEAQNAFMENLFAWLSAVPEDREDFYGLMEAVGVEFSDAKCDLTAGSYAFASLTAYLTAADGTVLSDLVAYLATTDGSMLIDGQMWLSAITPAPAFKSVVAQRLSPVLSEVI